MICLGMLVAGPHTPSLSNYAAIRIKTLINSLHSLILSDAFLFNIIVVHYSYLRNSSFRFINLFLQVTKAVLKLLSFLLPLIDLSRCQFYPVSFPTIVLKML